MQASRNEWFQLKTIRIIERDKSTQNPWNLILSGEFRCSSNIFEVQPKLKKLWWWSAGLMQWRAAMSLRPMQKNLRIVDQNFNQELQFFCMKLEVALNCNTDHSIYLSISLIRKPKLFEAIWWWTETLAAKCLTWIETWKQTYCVSWESSHNQNDWSGAHQSSREYPYLSMIQGLAGWHCLTADQPINQSHSAMRTRHEHVFF